MSAEALNSGGRSSEEFSRAFFQGLGPQPWELEDISIACIAALRNYNKLIFHSFLEQKVDFSPNWRPQINWSTYTLSYGQKLIFMQQERAFLIPSKREPTVITTNQDKSNGLCFLFSFFFFWMEDYVFC